MPVDVLQTLMLWSERSDIPKDPRPEVLHCRGQLSPQINNAHPPGLKIGFCPKSVVWSLGILAVGVIQGRVFDWWCFPACAANSLLFTACSCCSRSSKCVPTAQARMQKLSGWRERLPRLRRAPIVAPCAAVQNFWTWWSLFVAGAKENLRLGEDFVAGVGFL